MGSQSNCLLLVNLIILILCHDVIQLIISSFIFCKNIFKFWNNFTWSCFIRKIFSRKINTFWIPCCFIQRCSHLSFIVNFFCLHIIFYAKEGPFLWWFGPRQFNGVPLLISYSNHKHKALLKRSHFGFFFKFCKLSATFQPQLPPLWVSRSLLFFLVFNYSYVYS